MESPSKTPPQQEPQSSAEGFERAAAEAAAETFVLQLFVAGSGFRSVRAIGNAKALCESALAGRYDLEIIDIYQQPALAAAANIVAVPTLLKAHPLPQRKFVGDLTDTPRLRAAFGITDLSQTRNDERPIR